MTSVFVMKGMTICTSSLVTGSKLIFTSRCTTASATFSGMTRPNISTNSLTRSGRPALSGRYIIGRVSPTAAKENPLLVAALWARAGPVLAAAAVIAASAADRNRSRLVNMGCSAVRSVARRRISQLLHRLLDREAARPLARRELLEALQMLSHQGLRRDQHEGMLDEPAHVVAGLVLGALERIRAQVEQ